MMRSTTTTLAHLVRERAATEPDRLAFTCQDGELRLGELWSRAQRITGAIRARGIAPEETVAVLTHLGVPTLEIWVGLAAAGITEVPLSPALKGESLAYQLRHCQARVLFVSADLADRVPAASDVPALELVVIVGEPAVEVGHACIGYEELLAEGAGHEAVLDVKPNAISTICFTSGTTGAPKGVELSHAANFKVAQDVVNEMEYTDADVLLNMFPFSHINARYTAALAALLANARVVFRRGFSASSFWDDCREHQITAFNYLGGLPSFLLNRLPAAGDRDHAVRRAYGAGVSSENNAEFARRFGVTLVEVLGSTELGTICANTLQERKLGSCGRPVAALEVQLHDEDGWPVPQGEPGEVVVRPREPHIIISRYHRNPEATAEAFRGLWFHTGDRCRMDEEGWFYFVDRVKDSIRRRGENISSWEVEQAAITHADVAEAAAVGVAMGDGEEEVMLVVVAERPIDPTAILDHCQERLPHYAVPRYVRFTDELPRNSSARVMKTELRAAGVTDDSWDRVAHGYEVVR